MDQTEQTPAQMAEDRYKDMAEGAYSATYSYLGWTIVKDKMRKLGYTKGNPARPIIELWEKGYWVLGPVEDETGKIVFPVIALPPFQKL